MTDATEAKANGCTCTAGSPQRARLNGQYDLFNLGIGRTSSWGWMMYVNSECEEEKITIEPPYRMGRLKTREDAKAECLKWAKALGIDARPSFTKGVT